MLLSYVMQIHNLESEGANLHGYFSREIPSVLEIDSGDIVRYSKIPDATWSVEQYNDEESEDRPRVESENAELNNGHCLVGPVSIRNARAGHTLAVKVNSIETGKWGWTHGGGWSSDYNERLNIGRGQFVRLLWDIDNETKSATNQYGHTVSINPFLGVMGMPPDLPGIHPTYPPRYCGGNLDCKELTAGSTLYLPISTEAALFSCGDGHARQGDGEVSGQAIECMIDNVELEFEVHDYHIRMPRIENESGWFTLGLHADLKEASYIALEEMLDLMCDRYELARKEAIALASCVVDLRITQIVNGTRGVHAYLAKDAIR
ncbi:MAG: acetamidase/formamidase family protein [Lentisphaeria bacterium]|nr:acetamidase/formamidase family protein [Lentisphaeria bacterium]